VKGNLRRGTIPRGSDEASVSVVSDTVSEVSEGGASRERARERAVALLVLVSDYVSARVSECVRE